MSDAATVEPVTVELSTVAKIICRPPTGWAILRLEESTGFVSIESDWGDWSYRWPSYARASSLGSFLNEINVHYAAGKFLGERAREFSPEKTERSVKTAILEMRRRDDLTSETAREEWELASCIRDEGFDVFCHKSTLDSPWDYHSTEPDQQFSAFWERAWVPFFKPALGQWPSKKSDVEGFEAALGNSAGRRIHS